MNKFKITWINRGEEQFRKIYLLAKVADLSKAKF